jgi:hypothetical protein
MKITKLNSSCLMTALGLAVFLTTSSVQAQNIVWGSAQTLTGDSNLVDATTTPGATYFDALLTNPSATTLAVDGVTFNASGGGQTDGTISFAYTSGTGSAISSTNPNGDVNGFGEFSTASPSSAAFAALLNTGGNFGSASGSGSAGTVTISGLTSGANYDVEELSYVLGFTGAVTLSGTTPVTVSNDIGGNLGVGQFAIGTFTATGSTETFNWTGAANQGFPMLGNINVEEITAAPEPSTYALMLGGLALLVIQLRRRRHLPS